MQGIYKVPLLLTPQPEGGYTVTSPVLPELNTEGDGVDEIMENVRDALKAALETYEDFDKPLPEDLRRDPSAEAIRFEVLVAAR